jgi:nucleoid DNA-binding protein
VFTGQLVKGIIRARLKIPYLNEVILSLIINNKKMEYFQMTKIKVKRASVKKKAEDTQELIKGVASRIKATKDRQTRIQILQHISDQTGLKRVEVESVFTEMAKLIKSHMKKQGSGEVMVPKLGLKIRKVRRKPTKKRVMVSPLTGQEVVIPPKPARDDIKLIPLKGLKESLLA